VPAIVVMAMPRATSAPEQERMRIGDVIGARFEVERLAGSGGTSIVYRARDLERGVDVALKALRPMEEEDESRFAREVSVLAQVRHPSIVEYVAHGVTDAGQPYLAMEWLEGESLSARLHRGPLSVAETVTLGQKIAAALGEAHALGIVHRDIKPSNLLLCGRRVDAVKLLDFGVARHHSLLGLTLTGTLVGTPGYMAPEQARGLRDIDPRADVFALGCLLFRCLTGRPAFGTGDVMVMVFKILSEEPPRIRDLVPAAPPELDDLIARMLLKAPAGRPLDGAAVAAELAEIVLPEPADASTFSTARIDAEESTSGEPPLSVLSASPTGLSGALGEESRSLLGKPTFCVGREAELHALLDLFEASVTASRASAIVITGEPGIGKSRLAHDLLRRIGALGYAVEILVVGGAAGAPFAIASEVLRRAASISPEEPLDLQQRKFEARLSRRFADWLGEGGGAAVRAEVGDHLDAIAFAPRAGDAPDGGISDGVALPVDARIREAWEMWLRAECSFHPVLLVLDDLERGDPQSVELIDHALLRLADVPLMVLALARPEMHAVFPDLWAEREPVRLELGSLTRRSSERLVRHALGKGAAADVVARVAERAEGNALFLEELVCAVAEGRDDAVPKNVIVALEERLRGASAAARRALAAVSIFGRAAWPSGVRALLADTHAPDATACAPDAATEDKSADLHVDDVDALLADLARRGLLIVGPPARFADEPEYTFRHVLLQEAAHATLTDEARVRGHRLAAEWLERRGEDYAVAIAEHLERARDGKRAVGWYRRAAERALADCSDTAACAHAERGLACGAEGEELGRLRLVLAQALASAGDNAEAEAQAHEAMQRIPWGSARWYSAIAEIGAASAVRGDDERLVELAAVVRDAVLAGERSQQLWIAAARLGRYLYAAGRDDLGEGLLDLLESAHYPAADEDAAIRGELLAARARCAANAGNFEVSLNELGEAAAEFERAGDGRSACLTRVAVGSALVDLGSYAEAEAALRAELGVAERHNLRDGRAAAHHSLGIALAGAGALDEALRAERQAIAHFAAQGNRRMEGRSRVSLADIHERLGELDDAEREARAAVELLESSPQLRPYALATQASVLLRAGRVAEALTIACEASALIAPPAVVTEGEAQVTLVHAEALDATRSREVALAVIETGRARLLARAARIADAELRASFLAAIPAHARTLSLCEAWVDERWTDDA
jgi:eukaryotic-like serine/threonine-protein kinase